ncbi:hypothetical protein [Clostridium minihomine]|uniref:hypothetical protein n=1 Tax=Clostridium minihomine TaxID=2045012 RepID=UPI000C769CBE|nr:hypothetical protein [Clostridium minihomine]
MNKVRYAKKPAVWVCVGIAAALLAGFFLIYRPAANVSQLGAEQEKQEVVSLVESFGDALKMVSLTAPDDVVAKNIKEQYAAFVTPELLAIWQSKPQSAPGRRVSSPWPDRIEVKKIEADGNGGYVVLGEVIEVTSTELESGGAAAQYPITLQVIKQENAWRISSVEQNDTPETQPDF